MGDRFQAALLNRLEGEADDEADQDDPEPTYTLTQGTIQQHLRLDSAAAAAVTLLPDPAAPHQYGSLYNVLNRCGRSCLSL